MSFQKSLRAVLISSLVLTGCGPDPVEKPEASAPAPVQPEPAAPTDASDVKNGALADAGTPTSDGGRPTDGGAPASDAGSPAVDGGAADAGGEVRGSLVLHYRTDLGDFSQPQDPHSPELQAFALEPSGPRTLTVVTSPDGTFRIPDAPAGRYYLRQGTFHVVTDSRFVDLDTYELGRADSQKVDTLPPATLTVSNLASQPFDRYGDTWQAVSSNAGTSAYVYTQESVPANATVLTDAPIDYQQYYPGPRILLDASRGDYLYFSTNSERDNGLFLYTALDRSFTQGGLTMRADQPFQLQGELRLAPERTLTLEWWRSRFEAYKPQVHPRAGRGNQTFSLSPTAWGSDAWYGYLGELFSTNSIEGYTDEVTSFTYGNPYPFSWGEVLSLSHLYSVPLRLPGTTSGSVTAGLSDTRPVSALAKGPLAPRISPPQQLTVEGTAAQADRPLGSLTPRVTWKAPLLGTPSAYRVRVSRVNASGTTTRATAVATFSTQAPSLDIPPGVLQPGQAYVFRVTAFVTPGLDLALHPFGNLILTDQADADTVSGILSTPATLAPERTALPVMQTVTTPAERLESRRAWRHLPREP